MIDCREAVQRMWAYLDDALAARSLAELEEHLDTCVRCCGELEFSRHVRERVAGSEAAPAIPLDVRRRIERILVPDAERETEANP
jgi:mycothiol system anti-sigma-R factor